MILVNLYPLVYIYAKSRLNAFQKPENDAFETTII